MKQKAIRTNAITPAASVPQTPRRDARNRKTTRAKRRIEMVDDKLARDEAERAASYEALKSDIKSEVGAEVYTEAAGRRVVQAQRVEDLAAGMRRQAVDEVVETDREVRRARSIARVSQVVDYIFFLIYGLLAIR